MIVIVYDAVSSKVFFSDGFHGDRLDSINWSISFYTGYYDSLQCELLLTIIRTHKRKHICWAWLDVLNLPIIRYNFTINNNRRFAVINNFIFSLRSA